MHFSVEKLRAVVESYATLLRLHNLYYNRKNKINLNLKLPKDIDIHVLSIKSSNLLKTIIRTTSVHVRVKGSIMNIHCH